MLVYQRVMFPLEKAIYGGNPDRKNPQVSFRTSQVPSVSTSRRSSMPGKKSTRWCRRIACSSPVTTAVQERNGVGKLGSREAGALGATSEQNWKSLQSQNNTEDLKSCCCVVFFFQPFFSPGSCESVNPFPLEHLSVRFMPPPPPNVAGWLRMFPHLVVPQSEAEDALIWVDAGAALEIEKWPPFDGTIWSNFSSHEWGERHWTAPRKV